MTFRAKPLILVVEDDVKMSRQFKRYLVKHEFDVILEHNGKNAVDVVINQQPDILILDLMLPGLDGFEVCRQVRPHFRGAILMLTASEDDMDQVVGIEMGADDYVTKPVNPRVLLARLKLLLRRNEAIAQASVDNVVAKRELVYGQLSIHITQRKVQLNGDTIALTPAEFDLLALLAKYPEHTLSRDDILRSVRGITHDGMDRSVDVKISSLRKKLGDNPAHPQRIMTIRRRGYMFIPDSWE